MLICNTAKCKISLIALVAIMLSACSTTPRTSNVDLSHIGEGILNAGKSTADLGKRAWHKTTYLLGFSDLEASTNKSNNNQRFRNESETVALNDNADPMLEQSDKMFPGEHDTADSRMADLRGRSILEVDDDYLHEDTAAEAQAGVTATQIVEPIAADMIYEVSADENLWQIAKKTTGDATNWHTLADMNNLAPGATVFPGQELIVPAHLVKRPAMANHDADVMPAESEKDQQLLTETQPDEADTLVQGSTESAAEPVINSTRLRIPDTGNRSTSIEVGSEPTGTPFTLKESETLWNLAKRSTGNALNWKAIAEHNDFSGKQAIKVFPGQTIYVPDELVRTTSAAVEDNTDKINEVVKESETESSPIVAQSDDQLNTGQNEAEPVAAQKVSVDETDSSQPVVAADTSDQRAVSASSEMIANALTRTESADTASPLPSLLDETEPMAMVDTSTTVSNSGSEQGVETKIPDFKIDVPEKIATQDHSQIVTPVAVSAASPVSEPVMRAIATSTKTINTASVTGSGGIPAEIMVSGTYYPKAVYNEADFSSSLLMRVSPGTKLQVSNAFGTWFEVETAKGVGYVHQRDIK
ncbi:MAG: LysM peptidoglycan-binding domain-containing protein [Granulosicoccus sp.]|nr:LysM peptidoglycan-binding domain-containing protein [Granulosicoccus sp.]